MDTPVIRYHGGKFRLAPWILQHVPPHRCYVEPFGGAASVLLQKPRAYAEVYNDLDGDVVNLFRVLRDPPRRDRLIEALCLTPYARDEFEASWSPTRNSVERARRLIVRAQMGFGSAGATKGTTGFRIDTRRKHGTAQDLWRRYPDQVAMIAGRLQGVMIENRPGADVMAAHDAPDTLHYVDPPYPFATRVRGAQRGRYYRHELTDADHEELLAQLCGLRGMVLLSSYPNALYEARLMGGGGWQCITTRARISAGRGSDIRTECLWVNPAALTAINQASLFAEAM